MTTLTWTEAVFPIQERNELGEYRNKGRLGVVAHGAPFGIARGGVNGFTLTHIPTGFAMFSAQSEAELRLVASLVADLDWSFTDPKAVSEDHYDAMAVAVATLRLVAGALDAVTASDGLLVRLYRHLQSPCACELCRKTVDGDSRLWGPVVDDAPPAHGASLTTGHPF